MSGLNLLSEHDLHFPEVEFALRRPNGLLAVGGDLRPERLIAAYEKGIFPWTAEGEPLLWWSPSPRAVLRPNALHISSSMRKQLHKRDFSVTSDHAFSTVIRSCADQPRGGTWISHEMQEAYIELHRMGIAHSIEVWKEDQLWGGLYGLAIGSVFCGESMFHNEANGSKIAFIHLASTLFANGFLLIDCQIPNPHLMSLGVSTMPRKEFCAILQSHQTRLPWPDTWSAP